MNSSVEVALTLVTLVAIAVAVSAVSERFSVAAPLGLIVVGIAGSYLPFVPEFELTPEIVLIGLLPPLLYAAAIRTSLVDFRTNRRPIALLSVGLVLFTTAGIAVLVHAVLPRSAGRRRSRWEQSSPLRMPSRRRRSRAVSGCRAGS